MEEATSPGATVEKRAYFGALDGIRGVAALLIVGYHLGELLNWHAPESFLAVDVFFMLSGVVIASSYECRLQRGLLFRDFSMIRGIRLYPLYLVGTLLGALALYLSHYMHAKQLLECLAFAIVVVPIPRFTPYAFPLNPPAWSLFCEVLVNLAYAGLLPFLSTRILSGVAVLAALVLCIFVAPGADGFNVGVELTGILAALVRAVFSFSIGVLLYRHLTSTNPAKLGGKLGNSAAWALVAVIGLNLSVTPPQSLRLTFELASVLLVFPAVVSAAIRIEVSAGTAAIFRFAGATSYAVYALHAPAKALLEQLVRYRLGNAPNASAPWAGISFLAKYSPWPGVAFIAAIVLVSALLDSYFDAPLRREALKRLMRP